MKNKEKLEAIKKILKTEYAGRMSEQTLNAFANDLLESVFVEQYDFDDIPAIVFEYEAAAELEDSEWYNIFSSMIDLLENKEETAKRLYNSCMYGFDSLDTFIKLINENAEYLSAEQLSEVKEKAIGLFDKELLKFYGIE